MWKCPKCKYTSRSYSAMQKHYARAHPSPNKTVLPKGKQAKKYVYKPPVKHRRK